MTHHMLAASGYLTIFLPFALLIAGQALDAPYLAVAIVFAWAAVAVDSRQRTGRIAGVGGEYEHAS